MKLRRKILAALAVCALGITPLALAGGASAHPGKGHGKGSSSSASHGNGWGKLCQSMGESKKHVKGQKGTPFSQCVTAMAHLAKGTTSSPAKACASESKKHVAGQRGTPFSDCVAAGAKLLNSEQSGY